MARLLRFAFFRTDRNRLLKTLLLLVAVRVGLWILPFDFLRRLLFPKSRPVVAQTITNPRDATEIACDVTRMSRYVPFSTCLSKALVTMLLLRKQGILGSLCIGVNKNYKGDLEAHAWVESSGKIVIGGRRDLSRFTLLRPVQEI
jgi:Transglutaminase-like superfamily